MNPPVLPDPIGALCERISNGTSRRIIALVGVPGAGKSTIAQRLGDAVNERCGADVMAVLGMDGFHLSKAALRQMPDPELAFARRGAPWTFAPADLAERLIMLREAFGKTSVTWPDFQHEIGDPVEDAHEVGPAVRLVLVEGLYLLHNADGWDAVAAQFDERWFLDTPLDIALERLTKRHMQAWNMTREEAKARIASNDLLNAQTVQASRAHAEWLLKL